ncbi:RlpA-like double-psi beta-barrel-protein domain-containing protein-containing protein [Hygrophoropsis aurantiaca]|uniref:RlpA-like double-psi beta-barrel-protein domain-containing protein-containing protein n=1 Tax=Hygrophoropsis aurantiaca TaxID=72124 RepID=A0ACB8AL22_9AGAM|nr:RlpA-like double-psi beta-barrel-protein domain-containing protein-containing protein [Hygrophoropsis aurantiaca]
MSQIALLFIILFASLFMALAAPMPLDVSSSPDLAKRVTHTGRGTWFDVGLGACGENNVNSDSIVAISSAIYGNGGNCGQYVHVTNTANGKSAYGMTRDECPSCSSGSLDMSPGLFEQIGDLGTGVLEISWNFMSKEWSP